MQKVLIIIFSIVMAFPTGVCAEEMEETEAYDGLHEEEFIYHFPEIKPAFSGLIGYRFIDHEGSEKAGEYDYLHSSMAFSGKYIAFPFPHRFHLELDVLNKKDMFGDLRYAYKDLLLVRGLTRKVFHNLDNVMLQDFGTSPTYTVDRTDGHEKYNVEKYKTDFFSRVKVPNFPLHVYFDSDFIHKKGEQQQRFLSSYFPNTRKSVNRDIDWDYQDIGIGTNSHLGPVEIDVSHSEKRLDVKEDSILVTNYNGKIFPHNLMPDIEGSATTVKLHTSSTGELVASGTVSWSDYENQESGTDAEYFIAAGDMTYMPFPKLAFFVKYRHKETDVDNPDKIPVSYLGFPDYDSPIEIKPAISLTVDKVTNTVRYKPISKVTLNAEYTYERTERDHADQWKLPKVTTQDYLSLSLNTRIMKKVNLKAKYTHREIDAPAYNIQPDSSDKGEISVSWTPFNGTVTFLSYSILKGNRDDINYIDDGIQVIDGDSQMLSDRLLSSITFIAYEHLTITPSYAYLRNKIEQDLLYNNTGDDPEFHTDSDVEYKDTAHTFAVNLNYLPKENININLDVSHIISDGDYSPGSFPSSVSQSGEDLEIKETNITVSGDYEFTHGWGVGMKYEYIDYNDLENDDNDGTMHAVLVAISKRW